MSPAAAESGYRPALPAVQLPAHLAKLLDERAKKWREPEALKQLYTDDAWVLAYPMPGWANGENATSSLNSLFYGADNLTPVFLRTNGAISIVGGYYTRGAAPL